MSSLAYFLGILLQAVAGIIALLEVRHAPRKLPWLLISLSSLLIVFRRAGALQHGLEAGKPLDTAEIITLLVSILFLAGVLLMSRMFQESIQAVKSLQESEAALLEASSYARSLIEAGLDPLVTISPEGKITDVNQATEDVTGCPRERLIGDDFSNYFTDPGKAREGYEKVLAEGWVRDYPLTIRHTSGIMIDVLYNATVYRNQQGEIQGVFAAARDITERKRAEELQRQLEQQRRLILKTESLNRMAGAVAHHFNNMLAAVIGNLEMALDEVPWGSELKKCIDKAMGASQKAAKTSRFMLTYLGQTASKAMPVDPAHAIREALPLLCRSLPENIRLKTDIPSSGPIIRIDGEHLAQILSNLTTNAVEAIGEREGEIHIGLDIVPGAEVPRTKLFPIGWEPTAARYVRISVADNGCGIDPEDIDKLFDPFFSTKFTGRGLGLPVVYGLLRSSEGAISVDSDPGRGTSFMVFFPISEPTTMPDPTRTKGSP